MNKKRLPAYARKAEILEVALKMGSDGLFTCITREEIAVRLGVTASLINHHWESMGALRDEVLRIGCARKIPMLVVVAVMRKHPAADKLTDEDRATAINSVG